MGLAAAWPPALVIVVITFIYVTYLLTTLVPQWRRATAGTPPNEDPNDPNNYTPSITEIYTEIVAFHMLFAMLWLSFARSAFTAPGYIPQTDLWRTGLFGIPPDDEEKLINIISDESYKDEKLEKEREFLRALPVVERKLKKGSKNKGQLRYCSTCDLYKPDRTHHCRICNQCILRMDHHCPWIANCVGYNNYKFFLLFLFYGSITAGFLLVTMLRRFIRAFRPILDYDTFVKVDTPVIVAYVFALFLFIALFIFFLFHMSLVFNSLTTIELREKRNSDSAGVQHRWGVSHMKFDLGSRYDNFLHIFGSGWMWFFPIEGDLSPAEGTYLSFSPPRPLAPVKEVEEV